MTLLRVLAGFVTLAYAVYVMLEGALGVVGMFGPLPIRLVGALGPWMHLASGQPWWRAGLEMAAGFAYAAAGSQLVATPHTAWRGFLLAAVTDICARWAVTLMVIPTLAMAEALALSDKMLLVDLALGLFLYLTLGRRPRPLRMPPVLLTE